MGEMYLVIGAVPYGYVPIAGFPLTIIFASIGTRVPIVQNQQRRVCSKCYFDPFVHV